MVVAVVWDTKTVEGLFIQGVNMAVDEANRNGGILGRKLRVLMSDVRTDEEELQQARTIARQLDVVAVIGHGISDRAIPASIIYEKSGILFISPSATSPRLKARLSV